MQLGGIILLSFSTALYALPSDKCGYSLEAFAKSCCGADAEKVTNALETLYKILGPAINDLIIARKRPSTAYLTFFKDVSSEQTVRDVLNNSFRLTSGILGNCKRFPNPTHRRPKPRIELREFDDSVDHLRRIFLPGLPNSPNKASIFSIARKNALTTGDGTKVILSPILEAFLLSSILKSIHQSEADSHSNNTLASESPSATELISKTLANATLDDAEIDIGLSNGTSSTGDVVAEGILALDWEKGNWTRLGHWKLCRETRLLGLRRARVLLLVFSVLLPTRGAYSEYCTQPKTMKAAIVYAEKERISSFRE